MSKSKLGLSAYLGRPSPQKVANRLILVIIIILGTGFIKAGQREGWFEGLANLWN
ncbi:MAG: hypothetical protein U9P70_01045 [Patescibacteria group bacterium]|nr:hypothetical protein [Patescibacteria group bacterium]